MIKTIVRFSPAPPCITNKVAPPCYVTVLAKVPQHWLRSSYSICGSLNPSLPPGDGSNREQLHVGVFPVKFLIQLPFNLLLHSVVQATKAARALVDDN